MADQRQDGQEPVEQEQSIEVAVGEIAELAVEDLPGAGYRWVLREVPDGVSVLDDVTPPATEPGTVGGVVRRVVRLQALAAGTYRLELAFVRPWEPPEVPPARLRQVTVTAVPA